MGKNGDNGAKGAKRVKPNTAGKHASANSIPSFDESALSALTETIDKGLGKGKKSETAQPQAKQGKKGGKQDKKNPGSRANGIALGKKRDASGNVIPPTEAEPSKEQSARDVLLQEILALGGTEEDLDLLDGVESDEDEILEDAQTSGKDSSLNKELSKFVASLGIEGQVNAEASESEVEEEQEDDEDDDEEDEGSEDESADESDEQEAEAKAPQPAPAVEKKAEKKPNDPNRLVSPQ